MDGFPLLLRYLTRSKSFGPALPIETKLNLVSSGFAPGGPASVLYRKCWGATCRRRRTRPHPPQPAGAEALLYLQKQTRAQAFSGERLAEDAGDDAEERTPSRRIQINLLRGGIQWGAILSKTERCGRRAMREVPKNKRGCGLVVDAGHH